MRQVYVLSGVVSLVSKRNGDGYDEGYCLG